MIKVSKKIVIVSLLLVVMLAFVLPTSVQADEGIQIINPGAAVTPSPAAVTPSPKVTSSPVASPIIAKTPTPASKLPQTGIEDYTGLIAGTILIGLTSVFAYIKIKRSDV